MDKHAKLIKLIASLYTAQSDKDFKHHVIPIQDLIDSLMDEIYHIEDLENERALDDNQ